MTIENRQMVFNADFKTRDGEGEKKYIEGYFIRYNTETELMPGMFEEIKPEAVKESLANNDIRCLFNHDSAVVLGRTGNNTLELRSDENGLWGKVEINENDKQASDIYERVKRGDINACSFGFIPVKGGETIENRSDGSVKFTLTNVNIREVSTVTFPAYPTTAVQARKEDFEQHKKRNLEYRKSQLRERLKNGIKTNDD